MKAPSLRFSGAPFTGGSRHRLSHGEHDPGNAKWRMFHAALIGWIANFSPFNLWRGSLWRPLLGLRAACPIRVKSVSAWAAGSAIDNRTSTSPFCNSTSPSWFVQRRSRSVSDRRSLKKVLGSTPEPNKLVLISAAELSSKDDCAHMRKRWSSGYVIH